LPWPSIIAGQPLPSPLDRRLTYLLRRVTDAAGRQANAQLAPLGLDARHYAVLTVVAGGAGSSQQTIADTLGLDRATVVALVDALESQGQRCECGVATTAGRTPSS
jgi:DNA-binding MarR family transcriptional regulator